MKLEKNERLDDLEYKNLKLIKNKNYFCFGMDAVLLSDFAKNIRNDSTVIDLGTGTGIISILLSGKTKITKIYGIEIQKEIFEMANRRSKIKKRIRQPSTKTSTLSYSAIYPQYYYSISMQDVDKSDANVDKILKPTK